MPGKGQRAAFCKKGHKRNSKNVNARGRCKLCEILYHRQWRKDNKDRTSVAGRKWRYGITEDDYEDLLKSQNNCCAICKRLLTSSEKKNSPHVDHSHLSKKVRGILCDWCNKGLGNFEDSIESLEAAVLYLKKSL